MFLSDVLTTTPIYSDFTYILFLKKGALGGEMYTQRTI